MVELTSFDDLINPRLHAKFEPAPVFDKVPKKAPESPKVLIDGDRIPVVIVDNLHVKYQVYSSGKSVGAAGASGCFKRRPAAFVKYMPLRVSPLLPTKTSLSV